MPSISELTQGTARERWDTDTQSPQTRLSLSINQAAVTDSTQPAGERFFSNSARFRRYCDLTGFRQARMVCFVSTVGAATSFVGVKWILVDSPTIGNYTHLGTGGTPVQVSVAVGSTQKSQWFDLVEGCKTEVVLAPYTIGGDGVASPVFGNLEIQFR